MKVKYVGETNMALTKDAVYSVMSVEKNWYRIMTDLDEDYLFPPKLFVIIEE